MGRVKSTLDLIMEKTKHLSMNAEEKEAFEREQTIQKVTAPLLRYLKEERDADYLAHELDLFPAEKRDEAKQLCLELLIERLSPFQDNGRLLACVERLRGKTERERWEKALAPLQRKSQEELEAARKTAATRCREALALEGIQGSAVLPCADEQSPFLKEARNKHIEAFQACARKAVKDPQI